MNDKQKKIFYVRDLRNYLRKNKVSIETVSRSCGLSHMTIRRWLKKRDSEELPEKYAANFGPLFLQTLTVQIPKFSAAAGFSGKKMEDIMIDLRNLGIDYEDSTENLEKNVRLKLIKGRPDKVFMTYCKRLIDVIRLKNTPLKVKAICIGALLYFVNPIDLIPDHIPIIGYLDDLAVLAVALNYALTHENPKSIKKMELETRIQ